MVTLIAYPFRRGSTPESHKNPEEFHMRPDSFKQAHAAQDPEDTEYLKNRHSRRPFVVLPLVLVFILTAVSGGKVQCEKTADLTAIPALRSSSLPSLSEKNILTHLKYLASDELEGRATGEEGGYLAADYIADEFKKLGLLEPGSADMSTTEPGAAGTSTAGSGTRGSKDARHGVAETDAKSERNARSDKADRSDNYLQRFDATIGVRLGEENSLKIAFPNGLGTVESTYVCGEDFIPFSFSSTGSVLASLTFAGYGITSEQYGYDDYSKAALNGNVALVMRHEPGETDSSSVFGGKTLTHYADLRYKATNARDHGASAVMVTIDPLNHTPEEDELMKLQAREGLGDCGVPAIQIKQHVAEAILRAQGLELRELQARIDSLRAPNTITLPSVRATLRADLVKERRNVANVVGILTPRGRKVSEYVVVGAHYDHLGRGGESSLSKEGGIHNGADDNASGVSAMLELARIFAAKRDSLKRGIVFIGFVGEEIGVLGSSFYADNPVVPLEKTTLMLNLDMVGRMREHKLYAAGVGSSPVIKGLIERANVSPSGGNQTSSSEKLDGTAQAKEGASGSLDQGDGVAPLKIETSESGYGGSDHFPFYGKNVPVLFFFTGAHEDYHKVTDDWEKINVDGLASVVGLSSRILADLVFTDMPVPFTRAAADTVGPPGGEGYGRGFGARFGIVPDFGGEPGKGAKISGTSEGSPAEKAGLKAGDVIVKFAGKTVTGLHDLSYVLREKKPGDKVEVVVLRDGKEIIFKAKLDRKGAK